MEIILYIDEDDTDSHHLHSADLRTLAIVGPKLSMGQYNSACLEKAQGDIIILVNDDMVIKTPAWDSEIAALDDSVADKIYLAYANDLFKRKKLCTFPILSRRTCELLIQPYPHEYQGAFIDTHLFDIFKRLQRAGFDRIYYRDDLIFEHLHYRTGKVPFDTTYQKRGRFADDWAFIALIDSRQAAAEELLRNLRGNTAKTRYQPVPAAIPNTPKTLFKAFIQCTRDFLFDNRLPWRWRTYLWISFFLRDMAKRGMLWPFVR